MCGRRPVQKETGQRGIYTWMVVRVPAHSTSVPVGQRGRCGGARGAYPTAARALRASGVFGTEQPASPQAGSVLAVLFCCRSSAIELAADASLTWSRLNPGVTVPSLPRCHLPTIRGGLNDNPERLGEILSDLRSLASEEQHGSVDGVGQRSASTRWPAALAAHALSRCASRRAARRSA